MTYIDIYIYIYTDTHLTRDFTKKAAEDWGPIYMYACHIQEVKNMYTWHTHIHIHRDTPDSGFRQEGGGRLRSSRSEADPRMRARPVWRARPISRRNSQKFILQLNSPYTMPIELTFESISLWGWSSYAYTIGVEGGLGRFKFSYVEYIGQFATNFTIYNDKRADLWECRSGITSFQ